MLVVLGWHMEVLATPKETHQTKIGLTELSVKDTERVNLPIWAGVVVMVAGLVLLVACK